MLLDNISKVVDWRLCLGCGVCAYICPENKISLVDKIGDGIRPVINGEGCESCHECIDACPGYETAHDSFEENSDLIPGMKEGWGPILEVWEGFASDPQIRFSGSSGGVTTALALYCMEKEGMHGTLHVGEDADEPWKNKTVFSESHSELLSRTGSRYSPASPCDGLDKIESAPAECVFIGKPCDIVGVRKAQSLRSNFDGKVGVAIGIFCAGTPSTLGTLELASSFNVESAGIEKIRYRGKGWPGETTLKIKGEKSTSHHLSYDKAWGFLQKYRPSRCHLCPDGTSEFADISCGDPWYREVQEGEQGRSLVLVRTERGRDLLHGAMKAGYLSLEAADTGILEGSQKNLLAKRRAIFGRLIAMKLLRIPTPKLEGFSLYSNWLKLGVKEKARSVLGTVRRIIQRGYYRPS